MKTAAKFAVEIDVLMAPDLIDLSALATLKNTFLLTLWWSKPQDYFAELRKLMAA